MDLCNARLRGPICRLVGAQDRAPCQGRSFPGRFSELQLQLRQHRLLGGPHRSHAPPDSGRCLSWTHSPAHRLPTGDLAGWPHPGERATSEFLRTLKMSGLECDHSSQRFCEQVRHLEDIGCGSLSPLCERVFIVAPAICHFDQINSSCAESLIRFLLAIESAVRRNPRAPDLF